MQKQSQYIYGAQTCMKNMDKRQKILIVDDAKEELNRVAAG